MIKKNSFKLAFIYVGTILGAGFASGKELLTFFARFQAIGFVGFFLSCFLLSVSFIAILDLIKNSNAKDYKSFLQNIFGIKIAKFIEILNIVFLFTLFSAMLAGGGVSLADIFGIDFKICAILFSIFIFISLFFGEKAVIYINSILCPILIFLGAFIGIYIYFFVSKDVFQIDYRPFSSAIVYTSYNIITTISVLFAVKKLIINNKVIFYSGILGGVFIFFIGMFLILSLIENYEIIKFKDLPILYILREEKLIKNIYSLVILMAIYTTAIANGFALENIFLEKFKVKKINVRFFIVLFGLFASFIGFSNMVEKVYPIFGYLGLFQLIVIFIIFYLKKIS